MFPGLNVVDHLPETMNIATLQISPTLYPVEDVAANPSSKPATTSTAWRTAAGGGGSQMSTAPCSFERLQELD